MNKLHSFIFFCVTSQFVGSVEKKREKWNSSYFVWKIPIFNQFKQLVTFCLGRSNKRYKYASLCRNLLVQTEKKAAIEQNLTQRVYMPAVFEGWIFQKQRRIFNKMTKSWEKNNQSSRKSLSQCGSRFFLLIVVLKTTFAMISLFYKSVIRLVHSIS